MPFRLARRWIAVPLLLVPLALFRSSVLSESDTFWQIRVGLDTLRTGRIPTVDTYSWTVAGRHWLPNSWLFDMLDGSAYRMAGLAGVALVAAAWVPLIGATVTLLAARLGARPLVTALCLVAGFPLLTSWLSARPQLVDYAAVPGLMVLTPLATGGPVRRRLAALAGIAGLQALWINLHAAAPLGIAVVGAAAGEALARREYRPAVPPVVAATLGTLASPFGVAVFIQPVRVYDATSQIREWGHIQPTRPGEIIPLALIVLAAVAAWRLRWYGPLVVLAGLAAGGSASIRLLPIGAVLALAVLAGAAAHLPRVDGYLRSRQRLVRVAVAGLAAAVVVLLAPALRAFGTSRYPLRAVAALPAGCRLFNSYGLGGPVILQRPDIRVSQDSRTDLYGAAFVRQENAIEFAAGGSAALDRLGVTCVLIGPATPLAVALSASASWRQVYRAPLAVAFVRATGAAA